MIRLLLAALLFGCGPEAEPERVFSFKVDVFSSAGVVITSTDYWVRFALVGTDPTEALLLALDKDNDGAPIMLDIGAYPMSGWGNPIQYGVRFGNFPADLLLYGYGEVSTLVWRDEVDHKYLVWTLPTRGPIAGKKFYYTVYSRSFYEPKR